MTSVVLFDLDDTIFAHRLAVDRGIASHLAASGVTTVDAAEIARWTELEEHHYHRYLTGELDYLGQRRARHLAVDQPHQNAVPAGSQVFGRCRAETCGQDPVVHPRAPAALDVPEPRHAQVKPQPRLMRLEIRGQAFGVVARPFGHHDNRVGLFQEW